MKKIYMKKIYNWLLAALLAGLMILLMANLLFGLSLNKEENTQKIPIEKTK